MQALRRIFYFGGSDTIGVKELAQLLATAKEDLVVATGKNFNEDSALMKQFVKLYCRSEFDMLSDAAVDNRLYDIQTKILHSLRFAEGN